MFVFIKKYKDINLSIRTAEFTTQILNFSNSEFTKKLKMLFVPSNPYFKILTCISNEIEAL